MNNKFDEFYKNNIYLELKNNIFNYLVRKSEIRKVLSKIKPKGLVLEAGCGVSPTVNLTKNSVFCDVSPNSVCYLKNRGYNCILSDITKMKFKSSMFDVVVCSEVLEHVKDDAKAIGEIYRVLRNNGKAIVTVPIHKYYWWRWQEDLVGHVRHYEIKEIMGKLTKAGFKHIRLVKIGGIIDRVLTALYAYLFFRLSLNKKSRTYFLTKKITLPVYKIINRLLFCIVWIDAKATPVFMTDDLMVIAKKVSNQ